MTDTREFLDKFRDTVLALGGRRLVTPTDVIGGWRGFVEECETGYADNIYEFQNDLGVRNLIMKILDSPTLRNYSQMEWVREEIGQVDARYRALLLEPEVRPGRPWWEARIPRLAGRELAEDFVTEYGVRVAIAE
ncbi:hypothetical protein [Kribbella karoonensis]|uniref:Uncharacterized protein n=1 Tax=Kribbella karoonensis TaxID=324851 RepID=A0ABN2D3X7_9ACTN